MSRLDDRLTRELEQAARPANPSLVFERVDRRRALRSRMRKVRAGSLAMVVIAGTVGGFTFLSHTFKEPGKGIGGEPRVLNGAIVYSEVRNAGQRLWVVQPDGTGARQLTTGEGSSDSGPSISPDGRTVAFTRTDQKGSAIYTISIDGGGLTQLVGAPAMDPTWSPDGSQIAFAGSPGGPYGIYLIGANGTNPRIVNGTGEISVGHPTWSPDGGSIAFEATVGAPEAGATWDIYTAPVDGGGFTNLSQTPSTSEIAPVWSPDGSRLAFVRDGSLWLRDIATGDESPLTSSIEHQLDANPSWSPDGRSIVFDRTTATGTAVFTIRIDGSDLTSVSANATDPAWQPIPSGPPALSAVVLPGGLSAMRLAIGEGAVRALGSKNQGGPSVLLRIDPVTDEIVATIPLEAESWYVASGGGTVWIGSPRSRVLQRVDVATNEAIAPIQLPGDGVSAIAADDGAVWVEVTMNSPNQGQLDRVSLVRIDAQTSTVVATIPLQGLTGYDDEVAIGAGAVWVAGVNLTSPSEERGADLVRIDPSTNEITAAIPVSAFSVRAGANAIWVTSPADGVNDSLRKPESWVAYQIDPSTYAISAPIALPEARSAVLAVTDSGVWFSGYDDQGLIHPVRLQGGAFDSSVPPINSVYSDIGFDDASGTIWVVAVSGLERIDLE